MAAIQTISTILKHDAKQNTYKIALIRAINDLVLSFPGLGVYKKDIAIPLHMIARYWVAYYWPFCDLEQPILQGQQAVLNDQLRQVQIATDRQRSNRGTRRATSCPHWNSCAGEYLNVVGIHNVIMLDHPSTADSQSSIPQQ